MKQHWARALASVKGVPWDISPTSNGSSSLGDFSFHCKLEFNLNSRSCRSGVFLQESISDCFRKKPARTWGILITIPILYAFFAMHIFLPSYATARALTFLNFNFVMCVITLDLMLLNMTAKPFWAVHPAFILLAVPLLAHFAFKCDA